jgi:hypothetical protein
MRLQISILFLKASIIVYGQLLGLIFTVQLALPLACVIPMIA